jgi:hypothetical protein
MWIRKTIQKDITFENEETQKKTIEQEVKKIMGDQSKRKFVKS